MIDERDFKALQDLQRIMEQHGKELARALKGFQNFSKQLSETWKPLTQIGPAMSKTFGEYQKFTSQVSESLKPLNDFTIMMQKNAAWLKTINAVPFDVAIKGLKELEKKIITIPETINPISINPSLLISSVNSDINLKKLIKELIKELEEEEYHRNKKEAEDAAKKRKIEGFAGGKNM